MSALIADVSSGAIACGIEACWKQWRSLAAAGPWLEESQAPSILDPEALVLWTLAVRQHERRLDDQLLWWASSGSSLLSVQRMRTLLADSPKRLSSDLAWFAAAAVDAGDPRWRVFAGPEGAEGTGRPGKGPRELRLFAPSTLMLRLRAGLGVGARSDVLAFLLGLSSTAREHAPRPTVEVIATACAYSVASVRRTAAEMTMGGLLQESVERPAQFSVNVGAWSSLLGLSADPARASTRLAASVPAWRYWAQMFSFLAALGELGDDAAFGRAAPIVQASRLRDLMDRFRRPLAWNGIEWLDPRRFPGERYLDAFKATIDAVIAWVGQQ